MINKEIFLIETITPLHISSGEVVVPLEYFYENEHFHICNFNKIIEKIFETGNINSFLEFSQMISKDTTLEEILNRFNLFEKRHDFVIYKIKGQKAKTQIKSFIRHANGKIFIPGSSIKGALKTSILMNKVEKNKISWNL